MEHIIFVVVSIGLQPHRRLCLGLKVLTCEKIPTEQRWYATIRHKPYFESDNVDDAPLILSKPT